MLFAAEAILPGTIGPFKIVHVPREIHPVAMASGSHRKKLDRRRQQRVPKKRGLLRAAARQATGGERRFGELSIAYRPRPPGSDRGASSENLMSPGSFWDTLSSPATSEIVLSLCEESSAPVAQLDRAADFESVGRGFESLRARQLKLPKASAASLRL